MTEEIVIDHKSVENYLNTAVKKFTDRRTSSRNTSLIGSQLVEEINKNLLEKCPSVDNFKFIVHATVQEQWGQGSLIGAKCTWDTSRDTVVSVNYDTQKHNVSLQIFFVSINDEEDED